LPWSFSNKQFGGFEQKSLQIFVYFAKFREILLDIAIISLKWAAGNERKRRAAKKKSFFVALRASANRNMFAEKCEKQAFVNV